MVTIVKNLLTFEEFLSWDDGSGRSFELVNGVAMPLQEPNAKHEDVVDELCSLLSAHCKAFNLPYVPRQGKQVRLNQSSEAPGSSRKADIVVFAKAEWEQMRQSSMSAAVYTAPPLIIEVVSTNWRDDYRIKLNEYEALGVPEYWIIDHAGLGGIQYIGVLKQLSVTINCLINGEYQATLYQGSQPIGSPTFPQLELTTDQLVAMTEG